MLHQVCLPRHRFTVYNDAVFDHLNVFINRYKEIRYPVGEEIFRNGVCLQVTLLRNALSLNIIRIIKFAEEDKALVYCGIFKYALKYTLHLIN